MASISIVRKALEESIRQNTDNVGVKGLIVIGKPAYIPATDFAQSVGNGAMSNRGVEKSV